MSTILTHLKKWWFAYALLAVTVVSIAAVAVCIFYPPALPFIAGFSLFGYSMLGFIGSLGTIGGSLAVGATVLLSGVASVASLFVGIKQVSKMFGKYFGNDTPNYSTPAYQHPDSNPYSHDAMRPAPDALVQQETDEPQAAASPQATPDAQQQYPEPSDADRAEFLSYTF